MGEGRGWARKAIAARASSAVAAKVGYEGIESAGDVLKRSLRQVAGPDCSMRRSSYLRNLSIQCGVEWIRGRIVNSRRGMIRSGSTLETGADKQSLSKPLLDLDTSYRTDPHLQHTR